MAKNIITAYLKAFRFEQDNDLWTAYSDELGIASCGRTQDESEDNLRNAVLVHFRSLDKRHRLVEILRQKNVRFEVAHESRRTKQHSRTIEYEQRV